MSKVPHPIKSSHAALTYKEPMLVRVGRYGSLAAMLLGSLIVLYVIAWFLTAMGLRGGIQDWFDARRADGYLATHSAKKARISGFPFRVEAQIFNVKFAAPEDAKGKRKWVWAPEKVVFTMVPLPWEITTVEVDGSAPQKLTLDGVTYSGQAKEALLNFNWLSDHLPKNVSLNIQDLLLEHDQHPPLHFSDLHFSAGEGENGMYDFDLEGEQLYLPSRRAALGRHVSDILIRGSLTHNFAQSDLSKESMESWRDAGGTIEISRLQSTYGPLFLQGNGTMALDGELQPVGAFSARIQGFFKAINRLSQTGVIRRPDASMAKVVLGMLAKHPKNGGPATISLALTIQDKALYAGPVRLIELPALNW